MARMVTDCREGKALRSLMGWGPAASDAEAKVVGKLCVASQLIHQLLFLDVEGTSATVCLDSDGEGWPLFHCGLLNVLCGRNGEEHALAKGFEHAALVALEGYAIMCDSLEKAMSAVRNPSVQVYSYALQDVAGRPEIPSIVLDIAAGDTNCAYVVRLGRDGVFGVQSRLPRVYEGTGDMEWLANIVCVADDAVARYPVASTNG